MIIMNNNKWYCSTCDFYVFNSKDKCSKCLTTKYDFRKDGENNNPYYKWYCSKCNFYVYETKDKCSKCLSDRPFFSSLVEDGVFLDKNNYTWYCSNCDFNVFNSKDKCSKCSADRPI